MSILKTINQEIEDFKGRDIQVVPGFYFNQYQTIQQDYFYYNSKFTSGDSDDDGDRKYFENISKNPCKVFSKSIDFDTKNIRTLTAGGGDPYKTWFLERDLKYWMRDKQFGKVLNRIFKELPIFGSVVVKIVNGTPYFVDLRNFVLEQSSDDLDCSNHLIEIHRHTVPEFRQAGKEMNWPEAKVNEAIDLFRKMKGQSKICVYERYGEVEEQEGDKFSYPYKRVFLADVGFDEYDRLGNLTAQHAGVELASDEVDEHPYREFHAEKMAGRWLGIGVVETLYEPQIRINELANLQSKTSYWAALRLFQTKDPSGGNRNLLTDVQNGQVLQVDSEITQIDMSDRNLAFFNDQHSKWMNNRSELTFSYDVVQGERLPAGTPLGSAQIAVSQTLSYFEGIQENVALDIKEMIYEDILPQFEKENTAEHTIRLVGQDLDQYIAMVKNELVLKEVIKQVTITGKIPTNQDRDVIGVAIEESVKQGKEKILTIPRSFYEGLKYDIDIDITGESVDTRVRAATKFAIAQMITADPDMLVNPFKRKILMSYMEDGGLNPGDFFGVESKQATDIAPPTPGRAGGGVSAPPQITQALPGKTAQTM